MNKSIERPITCFSKDFLKRVFNNDIVAKRDNIKLVSFYPSYERPKHYAFQRLNILPIIPKYNPDGSGRDMFIVNAGYKGFVPLKVQVENNNFRDNSYFFENNSMKNLSYLSKDEKLKNRTLNKISRGVVQRLYYDIGKKKKRKFNRNKSDACLPIENCPKKKKTHTMLRSYSMMDIRSNNLPNDKKREPFDKDYFNKVKLGFEYYKKKRI